jgi:hypothetical protein
VIHFCPTKSYTKPLCTLNTTPFTIPALTAGQVFGGQQIITVDKSTPKQTWTVIVVVDPAPIQFPTEYKGNNTKSFTGLVVN